MPTAVGKNARGESARAIATRHGYRFEKIDLALYNLKDDPQRDHERGGTEFVKRLQQIAAEARADLGDSLQEKRGPNVRPAGTSTTKP
jgi:hypothetical protein